MACESTQVEAAGVGRVSLKRLLDFCAFFRARINKELQAAFLIDDETRRPALLPLRTAPVMLYESFAPCTSDCIDHLETMSDKR